MEERLRIEAEPEDLVELRRMISEEAGDNLMIQAATKSTPGRLSEPILVALVVALGGPVVTRQLFKALDRWLTHRERMYRLQIVRDSVAREISLTDLRKL